MFFFSLVLVAVADAWAPPSTDCAASDANLVLLRETVCASLHGCPSGNVTARGDWPNQVVYMRNLLAALTDPRACLNTTEAAATVDWLGVTSPNASAWWYTWLVFQPNYYNMPRRPGARIESPATLGRKCWAFAYLRQVWVGDAAPLRPALEQAVARAGVGLRRFIGAYDGALPLTMNLCDRVLANCFLNATYDPSRNGTCPVEEAQFYVGFAWEDEQRGGVVRFPFATYDQTSEFHRAATFAVDTAVNYII